MLRLLSFRPRLRMVSLKPRPCYYFTVTHTVRISGALRVGDNERAALAGARRLETTTTSSRLFRSTRVWTNTRQVHGSSKLRERTRAAPAASRRVALYRNGRRPRGRFIFLHGDPKSSLSSSPRRPTGRRTSEIVGVFDDSSGRVYFHGTN